VPLLSVGSPSYTKLTLPQGVRSHEISAEVLSAGAGGVSLVNWSVVSGPIGTIFDSINSLTTTVRFSNIGVYVLECSATNEVGSGSVTVTIEVPALDLDFNSWISSNQYGLDINNRTINADPDKDGVSNLLEYILNGSPVVSDRNILPTLVVSGENFVFSFIQRNAAKTYAGLTFQYSSDLSTWIDVPIPVSSGSSGFFNFKFKENDGASEEVSISIPKTSLGSSSGFFGRICTTLLQQ
jgi:hypothetical protein